MKLTQIAQTGSSLADSDQAKAEESDEMEEEGGDEGGGGDADRLHHRRYEVYGVNASFWTW